MKRKRRALAAALALAFAVSAMAPLLMAGPSSDMMVEISGFDDDACPEPACPPDGGTTLDIETAI